MILLCIHLFWLGASWLGVYHKTITILNNLMIDMFVRIAKDATRQFECNKKITLSAREIQVAVKLVLLGKLGKHAVAEGSKAITSYLSYGNVVVVLVKWIDSGHVINLNLSYIFFKIKIETNIKLDRFLWTRLTLVTWNSAAKISFQASINWLILAYLFFTENGLIGLNGRVNHKNIHKISCHSLIGLIK